MNSDTRFEDRSAADDRIDELCDTLESDWHLGKQPEIAEFIERVNEAHQAKLFRELLLVELECRRSLGDRPTQEEYLQKFPKFAAEIDAISLQFGAAAFSTAPGDGEDKDRVLQHQRDSHVAHFKLLERLGSGAMGDVWKAWDARLRRQVTLKLPLNRSLTENDLRRFRREGEAAAQFSHPQLASVYEMGRDADSFYLVARYVEGQNLQEYTRGRQISDEAAVALCAEIGEVLQHAHDQGVVHRDLKPANIIIAPNGRPYIIDFGLAKWANDDCDLTLQGELLGTPAYMSPEQASGNGADADCTSDVYSLGVILYELLTGDCPFTGDRASVIRQILTSEPALPRSLCASIPGDLETICLKAIDKDPQGRYDSAGDMAADLRRFEHGEPILARRVGIPEKCWRWILRKPFAVASIVVLVAGIAGFGSSIISLQKKNLRLEGYRPVRITTTPKGARVAIVPIDPDTGEPNPDPAGIVRPIGTTPLTVNLKSRAYLVETVLPGYGENPAFAEVYRNVGELDQVSDYTKRTNAKLDLDSETCLFPDIKIEANANEAKGVVVVPIREELRRANPLLPIELYVDMTQTTPADAIALKKEFAQLLTPSDQGEQCIAYRNAMKWAELNHRRLPSAAEYDAIVDAVQRGEARRVGSDLPVKMEDLFDEIGEWTTTIKTFPNVNGNGVAARLRGLHVIKGLKSSNPIAEAVPWVDGSLLAPSDTLSPRIGVRGVRSGTPRFVRQ